MGADPKVLFVYNRPRCARRKLYEKGECPDDALYAFNALKENGFLPFFSDAGHEIRGIGKIFKVLDDFMSEKGRKTGFHLWQALRLIGQIRRADLVYATADSSALPICLLKKLKLVKTPIVYQTIGLTNSFQSGLRFRFYRRLLNEAACVIHFSRAEGEALLKNFQVSAEKLHFVPFGVDREFYSGVETQDGGPVALGLDSSRDWKLLADALAGSKVPMNVYTNPDHLSGLKIPEEFLAHDPVGFKELARIISGASFVALPVKENSYTGATITLLSCMASGRAVIISRTSALADGYGLVHNENCVFVPPGDKDALRREILRLDGDRDLCRRIGKDAARHVRRGFTVGRMADDLASIFRKAL